MTSRLRGPSGRSSSTPLRARTESLAGALLRFVHRERASLEIGAVRRLRGEYGVRARHLDEPESAPAAAAAVIDERHFLDRAVVAKRCANARVSGRKGEISNVYFCHCNSRKNPIRRGGYVRLRVVRRALQDWSQADPA